MSFIRLGRCSFEHCWTTTVICKRSVGSHAGLLGSKVLASFMSVFGRCFFFGALPDWSIDIHNHAALHKGPRIWFMFRDLALVGHCVLENVISLTYTSPAIILFHYAKGWDCASTCYFQNRLADVLLSTAGLWCCFQAACVIDSLADKTHGIGSFHWQYIVVLRWTLLLSFSSC